MKNFIRFISIILAVSICMTAFAACGNSSDDENNDVTSTEENVNILVDETINSSENFVEPEKPSSDLTDKNTDAEPTDNVLPENANEVKKPVNGVEALEIFNKILVLQKLGCNSVQQKIVSGTIGLKNSDEPTIDFSNPKYSSDPNEIKFKNGFERSDSNGVALSSLLTSDINETVLNGNTLTITLKDCTFTDNMSNNLNGYFNAIDTLRVKELVKNVENGAGVSGVSIKKTTHNLSNGKIAALFNDDFTKLISVKVSFTQRILVETTFALAIKIDADFKYDVSAEYKQ